jgi:hypothetical protein
MGPGTNPKDQQTLTGGIREGRDEGVTSMSTNVQNTTAQDQQTVTQVFTFGYGHTDPVTGQSLADRCAVVIAASSTRCRELMIEHYGRLWAFQYDSIEACSGPTWTVTAHVTITDDEPKARVLFPMPWSVYTTADGGEPVWLGNFMDGRDAQTVAARESVYRDGVTVAVDRNAALEVQS